MPTLGPKPAVILVTAERDATLPPGGRTRLGLSGQTRAGTGVAGAGEYCCGLQQGLYFDSFTPDG